MANKGFLRSQNISLEKLNNEVCEIFGNSENAKIFWRDYVKEKGYNITATKCVNYFEEYVHNFNVKQKPEDRILTDRIDLIF